jgi:hypothetical protein
LLLASGTITAPAGSVGDDFNDKTKNTSKWGADEIIGGGVLKETNGRLEYSCPSGTADDAFSREWILSAPPCDSDWEMQMDVINTAFGLSNSTASLGVEIRSPINWHNRVLAEISASQAGDGMQGSRFCGGIETQIGARGGVAGSHFCDSHHYGVITGAVRMTFTSSNKIVTVFYDLNPRDGYQWVQYESFGLAGSGGVNGNADWGLADTDRFRVFVYGSSRYTSVTNGVLAGDNFLLTGSIGRFDELIAELQARSGALTGSTNKTEISQKKAIDKTLLSLIKPPVSLATDLKNAGVAEKNLKKAFPNELPALTALPPPVVLSNLLQKVFDDFNGDITAMEQAAQRSLDAMSASSCKDKAQTALDKAAADLAATGGTNFAAVLSALSKAISDTLKGQSLVATALSCKSSGGGGSGANSMTAQVNGLSWSADGFVSGQHRTNSHLLIIIGSRNDGSLMELNIPLGTTPVGTHFLGGGSYYAATTNFFSNFNGSATITKFSDANKSASGTFSMMVRNSSTTNVITSGTFNVGDMDIEPF